MGSYEVAIAGGGPAGAAAAIVLARAGHRVLLADDGPADGLRIGEGLPPAANPLLRDLGVLERFLADGHLVSYGNLCAWGGDWPTPTDFVHNRHGQGYQLDRSRFNAMLRAAAGEAGAEVRTDARLSMARPCARGAEARVLQLSHSRMQTEVDCRWVIDAGGRSASLARRLGGTRHRQDRLVATVMLLDAHPAAKRDADGRTVVEACEDGWWYSALLPTGLRLVAYLTDLDLVDHRSLRCTGSFWSRLLATRMLSELCAEHDYAPAGPARTADASTGCLEQGSGEGWLAVGDAALSFDPLSSQGIASALHTGITAARVIDEALNGSRDRVREYGAHVSSIYGTYLRHRQAHYAMEQRWPRSEFWRRRHEPSGFTPAAHPQAA